MPTLRFRELQSLYRRFAQATETLNRTVSQVSASRIGFLINQKLALEGHLEMIVKKRFDTQGTSGGQAWPPLTLATREQRAALGFPTQPALKRSGALKDAAVRGIVTIGPNKLTIRMADRAAPVYRKLGKFKITAKGGGRISSYASALNVARPFYGPLADSEAEPMEKRKNELLKKAIQALLSGESLVGALR